MATELLELYELFEKKLGKEEAKKAIELVGKAIESVREEAKAQKPVLKAELKDELRKELITKEEFYGETGKLRQEMETLRQEMKTFEEKMKKWLLLLGFLIMFLNKGTIEFVFKVLGLLK